MKPLTPEEIERRLTMAARNQLAQVFAAPDKQNYAEHLQQIAEIMGAPFESGAKIVQRVKEAQARHAETVRLLREMIEDKTEGPFFHEDEHGPESVLNRARAALQSAKE